MIKSQNVEMKHKQQMSRVQKPEYYKNTESHHKGI